jgi:hypothetical protein
MREHVYRDRKMMKWMPFNALLEQGDYIQDLLKGRERLAMPSLSPDQLAELNYNFEEAFYTGKEVEVKYYENYRYLKTVGRITHIDQYNKLLFVGDLKLSVYQIISIVIL